MFDEVGLDRCMVIVCLLSFVGCRLPRESEEIPS